MNIKPIIFRAEMVRAILAGCKTQVRIAAKEIGGLNVYRAEPAEDAYESLAQFDFFHGYAIANGMVDEIISVKAPCSVGDILYVKETWCAYWLPDGSMHYRYRASHPNGNKRPIGLEYDDPYENCLWKPSSYMPKEAVRIFLRVKNIRAERLQDMDEEAAIAEGFPDSPDETDSPLQRFSESWDKMHGHGELREHGYHANPWVWVIEFERCDKPQGWPTIKG